MSSKSFVSDKKMEDLLSQDKMQMSDDIFLYILTKWFNGEETKIPRIISYPFGTHEWCDATHNSHNGCRNGCRNCYAQKLCHQKGWNWWDWYGVKTERKKKWIVNWRKKPDGYTFMYPSMHDTFIDTVDDANAVIGNMLKANANVLFVSKASAEFVKVMIDYLEDNYGELMDRVTMRFSISSDNQDELNYWEGSSPTYDDRVDALKVVSKSRCQSSVSAERYILPKNKKPSGVISMCNKLLKITDETLWIGLMNHIPKQDKFSERKLLGRKLSQREADKFTELEDFYSFENVFKIVDALWEHPQIRWKESIKKMMIDHIRKHPIT